MKYINYLLHFILIHFILKYSLSYLIFPFKTKQPQINETETNISLIFSSLIDNNIFINLQIGLPNQTIEAFLRSDEYDFYISEKPINNNKSSNLSPYIFDVGSDIINFYDQNNSISLEITNKTKNSILASDVTGNISFDYFHFISTNKEKITKKIPFILYPSTIKSTPGVISLEAPLEVEEKEYNFIENLKENNVIDSYFWIINYTSDNEGNFIIGEQPHIFDPLNYNEKDLLLYYPFSDDEMFGWGLVFDEINFGEKYFRQFHGCYFSYELNYIKGIIELEKQLDLFFNKFIENGTCFKEIFNNLNEPIKFFYCIKEKYKENIKFFPKLKFFHFDYNYTFELNYKDLFIEKNDKYFLMIFFDKAQFDWYFGKPFLKKYSFLMNHDTKILGFYKKTFNYEI